MKLPSDVTTESINFHSSSSILLKDSDIEEEIKQHISSLENKIEEYLKKGSEWMVENVKMINLMMTKYQPMGGSYIKLPKAIENKTSLLNIKNKDEKCLLWSLLAALHPEVNDDPSLNISRVSTYQQFENELDMKGITYPVSQHHLDKVERQNSLAISVYAWDKEDGFYPIRVSEVEGKPIHLLLLTNEKHNTKHYVLIKSLSGLLSQRSKHKAAEYYCERCIHGFAKKQTLNKHVEDCKKFKVQRTEMPKDKYMEFKSYNKMIQYPVFIAADFESIIKPIEPGKGATKKTGIHVPCAYALKVTSNFEEWDRPVEYYRGEDSAGHFIRRLHEIYKELSPIIYAEEKMKKITPEKQAELDDQRNCYLCEKPLGGEEPHLDHCHYTGEVLKYAHPVCNQQRKTPKQLPIVIHYLRRYDSHLIIRELCKEEEKLYNIKLISKNMQQFTAINIQKFKFIDSFQHLAASLEALTENLKMEGENTFKVISEHVKHFYGESSEKQRLLLRKGVYPYAYMDSFDRFKEGLPLNFFITILMISPAILKIIYMFKKCGKSLICRI